MIVLTRNSAVAVYRTPELIQLAQRGRAMDYTALPSDMLRAPSSAEARSIASKLGLPLPLHVLTPLEGRRTASTFTSHVMPAGIPRDQLIQLYDEVYVCSPELLFILLCHRCDTENILLMGSELASDYALCPERHSGLIKKKPLLSRGSIMSLCDSIGTTTGVRRARDLAPLIIERARSPKESELALLLGLGKKRGGRGISDIEVNKRIDLTDEQRRVARRNHLYSDLFLRSALTDLEYDGNETHLSKSDHDSDERRSNALVMQGIKVETLTSGQLHDWTTFDTIAQHLELASGHRTVEVSPAIRERQHDLWDRLLFGYRKDGRTLVGGAPLEWTVKRIDSF